MFQTSVSGFPSVIKVNNRTFLAWVEEHIRRTRDRFRYDIPSTAGSISQHVKSSKRSAATIG
jgi:hypothetical protein